MLTGRQLFLVRTRESNISDKQLAENIGISISDILIYEYGIQPIPQDVYDRWVKYLVKV